MRKARRGGQKNEQHGPAFPLAGRSRDRRRAILLCVAVGMGAWMTLSAIRRRYWREGLACGLIAGFAAGLVAAALIVDIIGV